MQLLYLLFYDQSNVVYTTQTPYQAYPGNPQMHVAIPNPEVALVPLPLCDECSINAVKPGEDTCLGCLGESEPDWEREDLFLQTTYPTGTLTIPSGQSWTITNAPWPAVVLQSGDSIQITYNLSWTNSTSSSVITGSISDLKNKDSP